MYKKLTELKPNQNCTLVTCDKEGFKFVGLLLSKNLLDMLSGVSPAWPTDGDDVRDL